MSRYEQKAFTVRNELISSFLLEALESEKKERDCLSSFLTQLPTWRKSCITENICYMCTNGSQLCNHCDTGTALFLGIKRKDNRI